MRIGRPIWRVVLLVVVDAQDAADGGHEVERGYGTIDDGGGLGVGAADDLAAADAAAEHRQRPGARDNDRGLVAAPR